MRILSWIISLALLGAVFVFATSNKALVSVSFWPADLAVDMPLYLVSLVSLTAGLLIGGLLTWLSSLLLRFEARSLRKELAKEKARQTSVSQPRSFLRFFHG